MPMLLIDLWRLAVSALALWMGFLITRLAWRRWHDLRAGIADERTHPLVYVSYATTLYAIAAYGTAALGTPLSSRLFVSTLIVVTGFVGLMHRLRFTLTPPWRRPPAPSRGRRAQR